MSLSETCIRRPVMTTLLMMSFIVFGIFGYLKLPVAALPRVDYPTGGEPFSLALVVGALLTITGVGIIVLRRPRLAERPGS